MKSPIIFMDFQVPCGKCGAGDYIQNYLANKKCLLCNENVTLQRLGNDEARLLFGSAIKSEEIGFIKNENIRKP